MEPRDQLRAIESIPEHASVDTCFGAPTTVGDRTVIPVSEVYYGLGLGWGGGSDARTQSEGGGGGGGGGARARGVAVIEVGPDGVRVIPVRDQTAIALAGITFASVATAIVARTVLKLVRG